MQYTADQIRAGLAESVQAKRRAEEEKERADAEIARWLRSVSETEGITMTEAAEIVGVSRVMAYKMLR